MKLGFGFYRHQIDEANLRFALQCGCTHAVVHLVDYFNQGAANRRGDQPVGGDEGWGRAGDPGALWTYEELAALKQRFAEAGLKLEAIENFDPAHWHDVLLDGPKKAEQLEGLKTMVRNVGRAGIPVIGYNFSLAGVAGRKKGPVARGEAEAVYMDAPEDKPIPKGMVWNMIYDPEAPDEPQPAASHEALWGRVRDFLEAVLPVAEEAGVRLAAHPDDPPLPTVRGQPRLVHRPELYEKLFDLRPSPANGAELCLGTLAEMAEGIDLYEAVDRISRAGKIGYIHFRNVAGKVPHYRETFVDDGEIDMHRVIAILRRNGFDGVLIPDHTPAMTCDAPWHAGMAYACGYMRALLEQADATDKKWINAGEQNGKQTYDINTKKRA
ncbi:MAG: mannonate dehydratase [Opitutales bacterium]